MIHLFEEDGEWQVWTDTGLEEDGKPVFDGRCIGVGATKTAALQDAFAELTGDTIMVAELLGVDVMRWSVSRAVTAADLERRARRRAVTRAIRVREEE